MIDTLIEQQFLIYVAQEIANTGISLTTFTQFLKSQGYILCSVTGDYITLN
jgi:hypothetical protein